MQLTTTFNYIWTVRDDNGRIVHRNTGRDGARSWLRSQPATRNYSLFRQEVILSKPELYETR